MDYRAYRELAETAGIAFSDISSCLLANSDLEFVELRGESQTERQTECLSNIEWPTEYQPNT